MQKKIENIRSENEKYIAYKTDVVRQMQNENKDEKIISVEFEQIPLSIAIEIISREANINIVIAETQEQKIITIKMQDQPANIILAAIARKIETKLLYKSKIYFIGDISDTDKFILIRQKIGDEETKITSEIQKLLTNEGKVSVLGGLIAIRDNYESIQKVQEYLENLEQVAARRYLCNIYYLSITDSLKNELSAELKVNQIDLLNKGLTLDKLIDVVADIKGEKAIRNLLQEQSLLIAENQESVIKSGYELIAEKKSVSEGVISSVGYDKFEAGTSLKIKANKSPKGKINLKIQYEISSFDTTDQKNGIPAKNQRKFESESILLDTEKISYIGSIKKLETEKKYGILALFGRSENEEITIWARITEVK